MRSLKSLLMVVAALILVSCSIDVYKRQQETVFLFRQRLQRTVGAEVVLQVLHVSHAAQHGEYARKRTGKPESPGGDAPSRFALLQALSLIHI